MYKIFDAHTHVYPEKIAEKAASNFARFFEYKIECTGTLNDLENRWEKSGAGGFLLLTVASNPANVSKINEYAAQCIIESRKKGFTALAFGGMSPELPDAEKEKELEHCIDLGLSGIKLHPDMQKFNLDDPRMNPFYEMLSAKGLPITFHMGDERPRKYYSNPARLCRVLRDFPRLRVIAAHFGGYMVWDEAIDTLTGYEGLKFDTSSSFIYMLPQRAGRIISKIGTENLFFGTDYPSLDIKDELERFFEIDLTERERENILWNNAAEYFGF